MNHATRNKPEKRLRTIKVYAAESEANLLQGYCHDINRPLSDFVREVAVRHVKQALADEALAAPVTHIVCLGKGDVLEIRGGKHASPSAHQQVTRYPGRDQGNASGPRRAFSFPGQGARRVSRGALRPMRS